MRFLERLSSFSRVIPFDKRGTGLSHRSGGAPCFDMRANAIAQPSEVLVSLTVKHLVAGSGLTFEDAGEHELKDVPDRWHLHRVVSSRRAAT